MDGAEGPDNKSWLPSSPAPWLPILETMPRRESSRPGRPAPPLKQSPLKSKFFPRPPAPPKHPVKTPTPNRKGQ